MILEKRCPKCGDSFPLTPEFWPRNRSTKSGFMNYRKPCHNEIGRANRIKNWGSTREYHLRRRYGVTSQQVADMIKAQGGLCAICGDLLNLENRTAHQDHDHVTNQPRDILCSSCNQGLGNFKDSIDRLEEAIKYLTKWKGGE